MAMSAYTATSLVSTMIRFLDIHLLDILSLSTLH